MTDPFYQKGELGGVNIYCYFFEEGDIFEAVIVTVKVCMGGGGDEI